MKSEYMKLLFHYEVYCCSTSTVLTKQFELRHEVFLFLSKINYGFTPLLVNGVWLTTLSYLLHLKKLNVHFPIVDLFPTIHSIYNKVKLFTTKLESVCIRQIILYLQHQNHFW